ncbi:FluG domain-containing protein [Xylaria grammica]|nr:FluG domain-containing protein [Xylaria grammica]
MTRDPRAAKNMVPDKVWHAIPEDPEIEKLERQRQMLKEGRYRINGKDAEAEIRDLSKRIGTAGDVEEEDLNPTVSLHVAERSCLAEILWNQLADLGSDDLFYRRIQATELMTALCLKRETKKRDQRRVRMQAHTRIEEGSPRPDPSPLLMYKTQCPFALGRGLDHFDREHGKQLDGAEKLPCKYPKCKEKGLKFENLSHFKNHVATIHGIRLRPP